MELKILPELQTEVGVSLWVGAPASPAVIRAQISSGKAGAYLKERPAGCQKRAGKQGGTAG